jgi:hypothetical protein
MREHFNKLTPAEHERLALLVEECGEVVQIGMKIMRHGYDSAHPEHPEIDNRGLLEKEIGHVIHAVHLMMSSNDLYDRAIYRAEDEKAKKIIPYLHHQQDDTTTQE